MTATPAIPGYELTGTLGSGSFATVWAAYDLRLDREVAIKVLNAEWCRDPEIRRRFMNEARVLVTAESPRLARGFAVDETDDGRPYLVMALADRGTLGERMVRRREAGATFGAVETFSIVAELARSIADVHALGHLHRDIKPNNVLVMEIPRGSSGQSVPGLAFDERLVLSDFGLVQRGDTTPTTTAGGSPGYVAPEQAAGDHDADERSDLYPLGVIALEMLTGRAEDRPMSLQQATESRHDPRRRLEAAGVELPATALTLLSDLLAADPIERPHSATETVRRCEEILAILASHHGPFDTAPPIDEPPHGAPRTDESVGSVDTPGSVNTNEPRRGVWGQELHIDAAALARRGTSEVDDLDAEATVVRPRPARAGDAPSVRPPPPPAEVPDDEPRARMLPLLDVLIWLTAAALVAVAIYLIAT